MTIFFINVRCKSCVDTSARNYVNAEEVQLMTDQTLRTSGVSYKNKPKFKKGYQY
jgi:hypothetical protein